MKSELTEKLISICAFNDESTDYGFGIDNLTEEQRVQVEAELIKHFEFDRIVWMTYPSQLAEDKTTSIVAQTIKLHDTENAKYPGKVGYVYKILFTPTIYDPTTLHKPVKDGCVFAPTTYNPETFVPIQSITITWSPEFPQNIDAPERTYEDDKQMIRDLLEKVLSDPEAYKPEGFKAGMVRVAVL